MLIHVGFGDLEEGRSLEEVSCRRKRRSADFCVVRQKFQQAVWLHIAKGSKQLKIMNRTAERPSAFIDGFGDNIHTKTMEQKNINDNKNKGRFPWNN